MKDSILFPLVKHFLAVPIVLFAALALLPSIGFGADASLAEALDVDLQGFTTTGDAAWYRQTIVAQDGSDAAQSGDIADQQSTSIETRIVGPGLLSFWWSVSSESEFDWLSFSINGTVTDQLSGEEDWQEKRFSLGPGSHTLTWTYTKDSDQSEGADAAWLDQVRFDDSLTAPPAELTVSGFVTDAVTGQPLSGVSISIGDTSTHSDEEGAYALSGIKPGSIIAGFDASVRRSQTAHEIQFFNQSSDTAQVLEAQLEGYVSVKSPIEIPFQTQFEHSFSLSPKLPDDAELRIVLSWGAHPEDLDGHLLTPFDSPNKHIYYANPGNPDSSPFVALDVDAREGFGPETITIHRLEPGMYHYYVENYTDLEIRLSDESRLSHSAATVQIYSGEGLIHDLRASNSLSSQGYFWDILQINGATKEITILNRITSLEPPTADAGDNDETTVSDAMFFWDFGDGTTSIEENPTKSYSQPGSYSVSLTVHSGGEAAEVTKPEFIQVTPRMDSGEQLEFTSIRWDPTGIVIEWTGAGTLQAATELEGLWVDIPAANSPYTVSPGEANGFFRVRK